ncbi:hypothetical protein MTR67_004493 [Solanum verrucosum]|uniref:CHCH domain-containing protein n=1 Tax=Solanum verrucosum TaxID=315347 RepID=A0AAF0TBE9_SOLVR|nr:hypothetical protein MTR67_004493 [Solanum verrucosum]
MANSKIQTPAYPSAAKLADSDCYPQYTASLKCLEQFSSEKSKCQEHFDVYKECKKKEVCMLTVFFHIYFSAGKGLGQSPSGRRFEPQQGHWRHYKPAASPGPRGTNRGGPALKQRDPVGTASRVRKATPGNHGDGL